MFDNGLCDRETLRRQRAGEFCNDKFCRLRGDAALDADSALYADNADALTAWIFQVPDVWQEDFAHLSGGRTHLVSPAFREELQRVFPKFAEQFGVKFAAADELHPQPVIPDPI